MFGTFIKELRARGRPGPRQFCLEHGHDPSNWSKIEREVLPPPRDKRTLRAWAKHLGLKPASDDWFKFFDYAAVGAGRIPEHILECTELTTRPGDLLHGMDLPELKQPSSARKRCWGLACAVVSDYPLPHA